MLGQRITLRTRLADGAQAERSGIVTAASAEESDGGLARYRLVVQPWLALLAHTRRSQVFQERTLTEIVEAVFGHYRAYAAWSWAPTAAAFAGPNAPQLQSYDYAGAYAAQGPAGADRVAELRMQSTEARHKRWLGRSTVRSFTAGQRFSLTQSTLDLLSALNSSGADNSFLLTAVTHAGINNLPKDASAHIARSLGAGGVDLLEAWVDTAVRPRVRHPTSDFYDFQTVASIKSMT